MPPPATNFFILAGPTAAGKSELAVALAERCGGEIVGADAFQVYRGLDVLTAKPSTELRARVPHHLIGEIPLTQSFDVAQYLNLARGRIAEVRARARLPIVVGGTGMYLRALVRGLADLPAADPALRSELEGRPLAELQQQLANLDPIGASRIDLKNPRRVIRALEVCLLTGRPFSSFREEWEEQTAPACGVVLSLDRSTLNERIERRTAAMFASGVVDEVRTAGEIGPTASQVLGLHEIRAHLGGALGRDASLHAIALATRQYAKRQMTWFRREPALKVIEVTGGAPEEVIDRLVGLAMTLRSR